MKSTAHRCVVALASAACGACFSPDPSDAYESSSSSSEASSLSTANTSSDATVGGVLTSGTGAITVDTSSAGEDASSEGADAAEGSVSGAPGPTETTECPDAQPVCLVDLTISPVAPAETSLLAALDPVFTPEETSYSVLASYWVTQVSVTVTAPAGANVSIGGEPTSSLVLPLEVGANETVIEVEIEGASGEYRVEVLRRPPLRLALDGSEASQFGSSLTAEGDLFVVGAPEHGEHNGAVFTFRRSPLGTWDMQPTPLMPRSEGFGSVLSLAGGILAVGTAVGGATEDDGTLHLFHGGEAGWQPEPGSPFSPGDVTFGPAASVSIAGLTAAVSSDDYNVLTTFSRDAAGRWSEDPGTPLVATDNVAFIEGVVAVDADLLAVGVHNGYGPAVIMYARSGVGTAWERLGEPITAPGMFADAIALRGNTLIANGDPVRIFQSEYGGSWQSSPLAVASLGPISLSDHTVVVGAEQDTVNQVTGNAVHVFRNMGDAWVPDPASPLQPGANTDAGFGYSVASSGRTVFVGAPHEPPGGAVYVYE